MKWTESEEVEAMISSGKRFAVFVIKEDCQRHYFRCWPTYENKKKCSRWLASGPLVEAASKLVEIPLVILRDYGETKSYNTSCLPTLIVFDGGSEVGRLIDNPYPTCHNSGEPYKKLMAIQE